MYRKEPLFPYANHCFAIMLPNLPVRFYPTEEDRIYRTEEYVICFDKNTPDEMKERVIKDYAEYYEKQKQNGIWNM